MSFDNDFETLLGEYTKSFKRGDLVEGQVCFNEKFGYGVDIGDKAVAFLPQKEVSEEVKHGDKLSLLITDYDEDEERFYLSQKRVQQAFTWKELEKIKKDDEVILGEISQSVRGGLIVDILGVKGFVPSSQILLKGKDFAQGDKIELKILTLDQEKNNFILSNKKVYSDLDIDARRNVFEQIEVGQVIKGCVVRIADFGAFVDIGGVDGLLPLSQMSWKWVEHPSDVLKLGDKIDVEVIAVDKAKNRVSLSLKSLEEDPWKKVNEFLQEGDVIEGKVSRLRPFGAFVEVYEGIEALLSQKEIEHFEDENDKKIQIGDTLKTKILKINLNDRKITLSFE